MRREAGLKTWERLQAARRQRVVAQVRRLRAERMTRTAGSFHGTRATAYGDVQSGPELSDPSRVLLALVLFVSIVAVTLLCLAIAAPDVLRAIRPLPAVQRRTVIVCVQRGESMRALAAVLHRRGLIADASYFYWYWYLRPAAVRGGLQVQAGPYALHTGMMPDALAEALIHGPTPRRRLAPTACRVPRR